MFAQHDAIKLRAQSHSQMMRPSPIQPNPSPSNPPPKDEPPWWSPDDMDAQANAPVTDEKPSDNGGFTQVLGAVGVAGGIPKAINGLRAEEGLEALTEPLLGGATEGAVAEGALGAAEMGAAEFLPGAALGLAGVEAFNYLEDNMYKDKPVEPGEVTFEVDGKKVAAKTFHQTPVYKGPLQEPTFKGDENGLTQAYANKKNGTFYDPATQTEYVKGSANARDWYDDFTRIPFGDTANTQRYDQGMQAYNDLQGHGQPVKRIVGHSLGGSVALEMQKNLAAKGRTVSTRTFGAPVFDPLGAVSRGKAERFRHPLDPVSVLDRGATWGPLKAYSHSYGGFDNFDKVS